MKKVIMKSEEEKRVSDEEKTKKEEGRGVAKTTKIERV